MYSTDKIICVKIAQRAIPQTKGFNLFPFDRVYLIPSRSVKRIPQLFRVFLEMDLTEDLLAALNQITIHQITSDTLYRNYTPAHPVKTCDAFHEICPSPAGWKLIVPTYLKAQYLKLGERGDLTYLLSNAVTDNHNRRAKLPMISLHTPQKIYPLLCLACSRLPDQLAGTCTPGTAHCRKHKMFELPITRIQRKQRRRARA